MKALSRAFFALVLIGLHACGGSSPGTQDAGPDTNDGGITEPPTITSNPSTSATVGEAYEYTLEATGPGTITFSKVSGPDELTVNAATGEVTWTPTTSGDVEITLAASNEAGSTEQLFTVEVEDAPSGVTVTSTPLLVAVATLPYHYDADDSAEATGVGAITWSKITGPSEFSVDENSGLVTWTPSTDGETDITIQAEDSTGDSAEQSFTVNVQPADSAPAFYSTPVEFAAVGQAYTYDDNGKPEVLSVSAVTWSVVSGPVGFSIHPTTGVVSWTPSTTGTETITVRATNAHGSTDQTWTVEVGSVPTVTPIADRSIFQGETLVQPVAATPASGVTWLIQGPSGFQFDEEDGSITWDTTGVTVGTYSFIVQATNTFGQSTAETFDVQVVAVVPGDVQITSAPPAGPLFEGGVWTYTASATGTPPIEWTLNNAPSGMTFLNGITSGPSVTLQWTAAAASGSPYQFDLVASNEEPSSDTQNISITVDPIPPTPQIDDPPSPHNTIVNVLYQQDVNLIPVQEGSVTVTWSLDSAPSGMTINASTGVVSWTPSATGTGFSYTVRATNLLSASDTATVVVDVVNAPAAPQFTSVPPVTGDLIVGSSAYSYGPLAVGNPSPTFSINGSLPPGFTFDSNVLQNNPAAMVAGNYSFDIIASNGVNPDATQTISLSVKNPAPTVLSITPGAGRRQSNVPVTIRGAGFDCGDNPTVSIQLGSDPAVALSNVVCVDSQTLTAQVDTNLSRAGGVYDVTVSHNSYLDADLTKRFTVTTSADATLPTTIDAPFTVFKSNSPYVVDGNVNVINGGTLTIEPGAVIMFKNTDRYINIGFTGGGTVVANGGTPGTGEQIVFTRYQAAGGAAPTNYSRGLRFGTGTILANTVLQNVVLEFAGSVNDQGAVYVNGTAPVMLDSIIRESLYDAVRMSTGSGTTTGTWFDRNWITRSGETPLWLFASDITTLGANLTLTDNGLSTANTNYILVDGTTMTRAASIYRDYNIPYRIDNGITIQSADLTLQPGVIMEFDAGTRLHVATDTLAGQLIADGTSNDPIVLRTYAGQSQRWLGVRFMDQVQAGTVLRNVRIENFRGDESGNTAVNSGGVYFDQNAVQGVTLENCTIRSTDTNTRGVYAEGAALGALTFQGNLIDVTTYVLDVSATSLHTFLSLSSSYRDSTSGSSTNSVIQLRTSTGNNLGSVQWRRPTATNGTTTIPIYATGDVAFVTTNLTVAAGNELYLPNDAHLDMSASQLVLDGTSTLPVKVNSTNPGTVYWDRIAVHDPAGAPGSQIRWSVLENGGFDPAVFSTGRSTVLAYNGGIVEVTNTTVRNSGGAGIIYQSNGALTSHANSQFTGNTIENSYLTPLYAPADAIGRLGSGNTYTNNNTSGTSGHSGIYVAGDTVEVTATWPANAIPYIVWGNIEVNAPTGVGYVALTLQPGVELRFRAGVYFYIGNIAGAQLTAIGTLANPIVMTADIPGLATVWSGLYFWLGISLPPLLGGSPSTLDYVTVSYAGLQTNYGNINFLDNAAPVIANVNTTFSRYYGMRQFNTSAPNFSTGSRTYSNNGQQVGGNPSYDCVYMVNNTCPAL